MNVSVIKSFCLQPEVRTRSGAKIIISFTESGATGPSEAAKSRRFRAWLIRASEYGVIGRFWLNPQETCRAIRDFGVLGALQNLINSNSHLRILP